MAEDRDALLQHYRQSREELLSAIRGLSDQLMTEPSLDGWSVKDHLAHVALWDDIRASEVDRISAGHDSAWPRRDPGHNATPGHDPAASRLGHGAVGPSPGRVPTWPRPGAARRGRAAARPPSVSRSGTRAPAG